METEDYWIYNDDTLVFKPQFNKSIGLYIDIISKYNKLIFFITIVDCLSPLYSMNY